MKAALAFAATACLALSLVTRAAPSPAKPAADDKGTLARTGKVLFEDDFNRADMKPKWRVGKGFFSVKDQTVSIAENPEDKHGAYAYLQPAFVFKDVVVEFQVKLEGARAVHLMINDSKYKESHAGHILKASVMNGNKVNVADYKLGAMKNDVFDKMKDEKTTAEEKKQLRESIKDKSADFATREDLAQWHKVRVEVVGDETLVSIDGTPAAYLKSPGLAHETKNAIGFEVPGKSALIKDVKVLEAAPSADWPAKREAVLASLKK